MNIRVFFAGLVCLALAACATVPPPSLSVDQVRGLKLSGVEVHGADVIRSWPKQEEAFIASGKGSQEMAQRLISEPANAFPELRAYLQKALDDRYRAEFNSLIAPQLNGARPVRAVVTLRTFDIPSVARRVLVDQHSKIQITVDLIDAKTGQAVLSYAGPLRVGWMLGGLSAPIAAALSEDPANEMIRGSVHEYYRWLVVRGTN